MNAVPQRLAAALADRYRIERELGAGGMATVYLAADLKHDRKVAIKVLKPELAAVLGAERFVQEIKTTAALSHPHILPLFDSGEAGGFLYYVMPYIESETIREKLNRETQLGIEEAVRIATEVADALDYAHRNGVIHRDIKPENILLHDGRAMVMDFGIALAVSAAAGGRMTETGLSLGTPHYMSPEQATADKDITGRSDVYSLASVLYEMLAGEPPHMGNSAQQVIMKIIADTPRPVTELRKSVPAHVAAAIGRALEKLPADRFESARAFADALKNPMFGGATTTSRTASQVTGGAGTFSGRILGAVAVVGLAIGVATARLFWGGSPDTAQTSRLMLQFPANQQPRYASLGLYPLLAQAPGGTGLLYWGPGQTTRAQLMLRTWDRLPARRLSVPVEEGCCIAVSPTGDSLAFLTGPHALNVVPLSGGVPRVIADSGLTSVTDFGGGADWADDGRIYASGAQGLIRVASHGGKVEGVASLDVERGDLRYLWPSVLPGSRAALLTVIPAKGAADPSRFAVGVADFRTGKVDILAQGLRAVYAPTGHIIVAKANGSLWAAPFDAKSLRLTGRERELPDTALTNGGIVDLSLSAHGTLAYTRGVLQSVQAVWVSRTGDAQPIATDVAGETAADPALSPDGRRMVFSLAGADGRIDLWVKPLDGSPRSRLTFDGTQNNRASWRSNASIVFNSDRDSPFGSFQLFERNADGSGALRRPELHDPRRIGGHTFSPDGKWLIFRTDDQEAGNADIMGIRPGVDSVAKPLVATAAEELSPAISPDGRWIAYSSNETGRREVYVRPFPEAANGRYQISTTGGISPAWGRDGRELFFVDGANNMVSVPVMQGSAFQTGSAQTLFSMDRFPQNAFFRQYDVSADGKRFLMMQGQTDGAVHVVVVFNFLDELKRVMAAR